MKHPDDMSEAELVVEISALIESLEKATGGNARSLLEGKAAFAMPEGGAPVYIPVSPAASTLFSASDRAKLEAARLSDNVIPFIARPPC